MTDGGNNWSSRGFGSADFGADDPGYGDELDSSRTERHGDGRQADPYGRTAHDPRSDPRGWATDDRQSDQRGWAEEFDRHGYGRQGPGGPDYGPGYGEQEQRYGDPGGYGGYGAAGDYRGAGGYGDRDRYQLEPGTYSSQGGYGDLGEHRDHGDYSHPAGYGDQGGYGSPPAYPGGAHPGERFSQADHGASGSYDPYMSAPYGGEPYSGRAPYLPHSDATSPYDWPGERQQADPRAAHPYDRSSSLDDTGSYDAPSAFGMDTGSFGRPDTGSFGRPDTGSFGRPDTGSFGRDDLSRDEIPRSARGALPPGSDGYAQWRSDPDEQGSWDDRDGGGGPGGPGDDDWGDEGGDDGPVSRFFTRDERGGARGRGRRPRRLRGRLGLTAALLAGALVLGMVADFGYEYIHNWITNRYGDYPGGGYGTVRVTVPQGSSLTQLGPTLLSDGVIMALRPYDSAANSAQGAAGLQPGVYLLKYHMNAALAVAALLNPKNRSRDQITIIEGWRASQIAIALAKQTGISASQFTQIIEHPPASLGLPKWAPAGKSAEGFLFPDTYTLLPHMTALTILRMMVNDFNQRTASLRLPVVAPQKFVTPYQILIAASLIQAEGGSTSDFGKISRVIWNRIRQHILLGFDSTVFYAMGTYGTYLKNAAQENYNSKYNTYKYLGLPPGPIGSPGLAAIQAALHAPRGSELYFVTDTRHKPYITYFTSSYPKFLRWKQEFEG